MAIRSGPGRLALAVALVGAAASGAHAQEGRFVLGMPLDDGRTVIVAEGDLEPRTEGSYAIRLYASGSPPGTPGRFVVGITRPRDGAVDRLLWHDFDRDGRRELVVVIVRDGDPAWASAEAYSFGRNRIARRAGVARLAVGADPVAALAAKVRRATAP